MYSSVTITMQIIIHIIYILNYLFYKNILLYKNITYNKISQWFINIQSLLPNTEKLCHFLPLSLCFFHLISLTNMLCTNNSSGRQRNIEKGDHALLRQCLTPNTKEHFKVIFTIVHTFKIN